MKASLALIVDPRRAHGIAEQLLARRPGYAPEWIPRPKGPGDALVRIQARFLEAILQRLNQAPDKSKLAFLDMLGIGLIPARSARSVLVFELGEKAPAVRLPAGSQASAPPPPQESDPVVFESERDLGLTPGRLKQVVSLWPGRDQYIDHSSAFSQGQPLRLFEPSRLENTPHILYVAHDTLLALSGKARVELEFELSQPGNRPLDLVWEYWDGKLWRGFKEQRPDCEEVGQEKPDGSDGLTRSGGVRLETDCAETEQTAVNGQDAYWIRGRLDEPLPLDPTRILPQVSQLRLSSLVERPVQVRVLKLEAVYSANIVFTTAPPAGSIGVSVRLQDGDGRPLANASVEIPRLALPRLTASEGQVDFTLPAAQLQEFELEVTVLGTLIRRRLSYRPPAPSRPNLELNLTLQVGGLQPDSAFSDAQSLDLTKPFYPLGQQPQPGTAFYFSSQEVFSKPGAEFSVHLQTTVTPQSQFDVATSNVNSPAPDYLDHRLTWEYWNGSQWFPLNSVTGTVEDANSSADAFSADGAVELIVPEDMAPAKVNDEEGLWMRVRLVSGSYGFNQQVVWNDGNGNNTFTYFIPQPPALSDFRISYAWRKGPLHAERVFTYNDFQFADRTDNARWPGDAFAPIEQIADVTPALYLGLDQAFPVDRVGVFFNIEEEGGLANGPALIWEYWNGFNWRPLTVEDGTYGLAHPGVASFIAPSDAQEKARFGDPLYWIRARLKEDRPPLEALIRGIHPNAVWASQLQTVREENLGTSSGQARQVFALGRFPILEGERIEVQELSGGRANVEWRITAQEVLGQGQEAVRELEDLLGREGTQPDIVKGDLRLRRDRNKRVSQVWVRWQERPHLLDSADGDRHYLLDRVTGRLLFGDGEKGRIPPLEAQIVAREYRSGGGIEGNVAAGAITQMLAGVAGIESVSNPLAAEGGADAETLESFRQRGPRTLRRRGRGISAGDLETLAREASSAVGAAQALPSRDSQGRRRPGWATLVIIPRGKAPRPWPSFGLRERVRRFVEEHASADVAGLRQFYVTGPEYLPVDVQVTAAPTDADLAGKVEEAARRAVEAFLHPLDGGPEGQGWRPGRDIYLSDLSALLERVEGLDYVKELTLLVDGEPRGEAVEIPAGKFPVSGEIQIKLTA